MGADKALLDLGGRCALQRILDCCAAVGETVVVRRADAAPVAAVCAERAHVVTIEGDGDMLHSIKEGWAARRGDGPVLIFPVDHAMVGAAVPAALLAHLDATRHIALPLFEARPGHPIALAAQLISEVSAPRTTTLRDVIGADPSRVAAVTVADPWVLRDLDTPEDLDRARAWLKAR